MEVPLNGWCTMENPLKMDDLGGPPCMETSDVRWRSLMECGGFLEYGYPQLITHLPTPPYHLQHSPKNFKASHDGPSCQLCTGKIHPHHSQIYVMSVYHVHAMFLVLI